MNKFYYEKYHLLNSKYNDILIGFLVFITLYMGRDTLVCNDLIGFNLTQFLMASLFMVYGIIFLVTNRKELKKIILDIRIPIFILLSLLIILIMIIKNDYTYTYLSMIFAILCTIFLSYFTTLKQISKYFVYTILFFTIYSLITNYLLRNLIFEFSDRLPILTNSADNKFINLFFTFIFKQDHYYRNFCIYREPGVFQFFLIFSILFETFIIKHSLKIKLFIIFALCFGMLSTFSTTGFIEIILYFILVFILYFKKIFNTHKKRMLLIIGLLLFIIVFSCAMYFNKDLYWTFKPMITKLYTFNSSLTARLDSIYVNLLIFFNHPIIGDTVYNVLNAARHNTSSTLIMFSMFGTIIGSIYFLVWSIMPYLLIKDKNFICNKSLKYSVYLIIFIIIFISFNSENIITNLYFILIPLMLIIDNLNIVYKKEIKNENTILS